MNISHFVVAFKYGLGGPYTSSVSFDATTVDEEKFIDVMRVLYAGIQANTRQIQKRVKNED